MTTIDRPGTARTTPSSASRPPGPPPPTHAVDDRLWVGPTLIAALAVLAGASALSAAIADADWVVPLIEVVGVVWLLGVGCRLLRTPAPVTVLVQFAGLVIALTGLFTTSGWGGFVPNAPVLREAGELLSGAWQQILGTVPPAPATVELSFLIALTVGTTALIVDFLVAEARSPALVALPLLCLYSVPASIATEQLDWWTFAAPATLYALLLAVTGRVGSRSRGRTTVGLVVSAVVISTIGTLAAVAIGDSVTGIGTEGRLPRNAAGGASQIGLSPFTSLRGDLQRTAPADLITVSGLRTPDYLRTTSLEKWTPGEDGGFSEVVGDVDSEVGGPLPGVNPLGAEPVPIQIRSSQWADKYLPIYGRTLSVSGLAAGWSYDQQLNSVQRDDRLNPRTYSLRAAFPEPTAEQLRGDTVSPDARLVDASGILASVREQAQEVTADAATPFDKADALKTWFTDPANGFVYSLQVPPGTTGDPLADFLVNKEGYCEQYASAMTAMLRTLDIPARVAVGFTQGTQEADGTWQITTNDAHAWVEVRFDQAGWVRFDPTPLGNGSGNQQGFAEDEGGPGAGTGTEETTTEETTTDANEQLGTADVPDGGGLNADTGGADQPGGGAADTAQDSAPTGVAAIPAALWWSVAVLLVAVLIGAVPTVVRRMRRRRRLTLAGTGGPGAATAAWAEVEDLIVDHGLPLPSTESGRATANRLARSSRLTENARQRLRGLVVAAEREWYSERDPSAADPGSGGTAVDTRISGHDLVAAVGAVQESLQRSSPLSRPDRLLPRSLRQTRRR